MEGCRGCFAHSDPAWQPLPAPESASEADQFRVHPDMLSVVQGDPEILVH